MLETMRPLPVEPMAGTPPFMLGISVVRGVAMPVADPAWLFGTSATEAIEQSGMFWAVINEPPPQTLA